MKITKNNKGITLIALVITIIVLLILAGVGINMAISSDGLFAKAHEAVDKWNQSVAEEGKIYENLLLKANELNGGGTTDPTEPTEPPTPTLPEGWDENKVGSVFTDPTTKKQVPIPNGYTVSEATGEKTIDDGLVIYQDGEEGDSTPVTDETKDTALTTRNQYVWIPVDDINDMIMCKQNKSGSICDIEIENGILKCKTHPIESDTAEEWQKQIVGRLYTSTNQKVGDVYTYTMDFKKKDQTYEAGSSYHEPNTVSNDASNGVELTTLQKDFYTMAKSVATYGGFYIGRYEIGENGNSKKEQKVLIASSRSGSNYLGANKWYGLYTTAKKDGTNTSPSSHMIWGSQYDQVIKFIGLDAQTGHKEGNYATTTSQLSGTTTPMKNIYDLEGNYSEWIAEAVGTSSRVSRGGYCGDAYYGDFNPASSRDNVNPTYGYINYSSRPSLYL